MTDSRRTLATR